MYLYTSINCCRYNIFMTEDIFYVFIAEILYENLFSKYFLWLFIVYKFIIFPP